MWWLATQSGQLKQNLYAVSGGLALQGNPWSCSCSNRWVGLWLRRWMRETLQLHTSGVERSHAIQDIVRGIKCDERANPSSATLRDSSIQGGTLNGHFFVLLTLISSHDCDSIELKIVVALHFSPAFRGRLHSTTSFSTDSPMCRPLQFNLAATFPTHMDPTTPTRVRAARRSSISVGCPTAATTTSTPWESGRRPPHRAPSPSGRSL